MTFPWLSVIIFTPWLGALLLALWPGAGARAPRTVALLFLLAGLASALVGVMSHLFEQVDRRSEEARLARRHKRRGTDR